MKMNIDDEAEEKFFQGRSEVLASCQGMTFGEACIQEMKYYVKKHKKPKLYAVDWDERKKAILLNTPLSETLVDMVASYEINLNVTQKEFLVLKNWFIQYDLANRYVRTAKISLFLTLCLSCMIELVYVKNLNNTANKTQCQTALNVLAFFHMVFLGMGTFFTPLCTGFKTIFHKPDFLDRFTLRRLLRTSLSIPLNEVTENDLNKSIANTKQLLHRSNRWDSTFFIYTLTALSPLGTLIYTLGLDCFPEYQRVEGTLLVTNTISLGLAAFGLYEHNQRKKLGLQELDGLDSKNELNLENNVLITGL